MTKELIKKANGLVSWRTMVFEWKPFPRDPITDDDFDALGDKFGEWAQTHRGDHDPMVAMSMGVLRLGYPSDTDYTEEQWIDLCLDMLMACGLEGDGRLYHEYVIMTDHTEDADDLVTCDRCQATSESGWGDTPLCLDCEKPSNICQKHLRTFHDTCPLCEVNADGVY